MSSQLNGTSIVDKEYPGQRRTGREQEEIEATFW